MPAEWKDSHVELLFEGVYKDAEVSVNGVKAAEHHYGYTPFRVCLDGLVNYGTANTICVTADNSKLPNSRWYTGGGIYRPVSLLTSAKIYSLAGSEGAHAVLFPAKIEVKTAVAGEAKDVETDIRIFDGETVVAGAKGPCVEIEIPEVQLWSAENPKLYTARVTIRKGEEVLDEACESFGIRKLEWSTKGLFINGVSTLLRGGCVHHDNGILGAAEYAVSAERKVRILKESGFNAIRVAHNPASTALLDACDRIGMYVMDESFDITFIGGMLLAVYPVFVDLSRLMGRIAEFNDIKDEEGFQ